MESKQIIIKNKEEEALNGALKAFDSKSQLLILALRGTSSDILKSLSQKDNSMTMEDIVLKSGIYTTNLLGAAKQLKMLKFIKTQKVGKKSFYSFRTQNIKDKYRNLVLAASDFLNSLNEK